MLHLCVDARLYNASGIGTYLKGMLPFLQKYTLTLLVNTPLPIDARQIPMKSGIYTLKEQFELPLKIPRCDLFWSPHYNIPLLPIRARKRLVTIHDVYHLAHFSTLTLQQKLYAKVMVKAALRLSDAVVTVSQFSADEIATYAFCPKNLTIVPPTPLKMGKGEPIEGLPNRYLLFVGNLKAHKNLKRLFEAHAHLENPLPLVVVGKDFGEIPLPPHVHYAGYVPDAALPTLYSGAEMLLFPSIYEGFGLPPLEAMACGCPVLAARAASIPEVCGDAAQYVDPYSVDSMRKGIEHLLNDRGAREKLVEKGRMRVKGFTSEKIVGVIDACCRRS